MVRRGIWVMRAVLSIEYKAFGLGSKACKSRLGVSAITAFIINGHFTRFKSMHSSRTEDNGVINQSYCGLRANRDLALTLYVSWSVAPHEYLYGSFPRRKSNTSHFSRTACSIA